MHGFDLALVRSGSPSSLAGELRRELPPASLVGTLLLDRYVPQAPIEQSMLAAVRDGLFGWTSQRLVRSQAAKMVSMKVGELRSPTAMRSSSGSPTNRCSRRWDGCVRDRSKTRRDR